MSKGHTRRDDAQKLLAAFGVVGPILWAIGWIVGGLLWPGYDHVTQSISEIGAVGAPNSTFFNVAVVLFGLLVIAFAVGLHRGISGGKGSVLGPALVAGYGVTRMTNGVFQCDPGCYAVSLSGWIHNIGGTLGILSMVVGLLLLSRRLKNDVLWQPYSSYAVATSLVTLVLWVAQVLGLGAILGVAGVVQRVWLGIVNLWVVLMAVRLFGLSVRSSITPLESQAV